MRLKHSINFLILFLTVVTVGGCGFFRYQIIPQNTKGPHGGAMVLIDERVSRYVEFVATPQDEEWLLQLYAYNNKMKPRDFSSFADVEIMSGEEKVTSARLWGTKTWSFPWTPPGHLERKVKLGNLSKFKARVLLYKSKRNFSPDELHFEYPY